MKIVTGATLVALLGVVSPMAAQEGSTQSTAERAPRFRTSVIASGLQRPSGIAIRGSDEIYFTELPTPGVPGSAGGSVAQPARAAGDSGKSAASASKVFSMGFLRLNIRPPQSFFSMAASSLCLSASESTGRSSLTVSLSSLAVSANGGM